MSDQQSFSHPTTLKQIMRACTCPACGHHVAVPFYDGGKQPLTTLAWPRSTQEATAMTRLPLSFVRCVDCGHVYNTEFDYSEVPYSDKPNLMFNKGTIWSQYLSEIRDLLLDRLPATPTVVEVGCGDGHLLRALAQARPGGRYLGFDPNSKIDTGGGLIEARTMLFDPAVHLSECRPDLIISRHVLEHLMNPLGFVQAIAFAASWEDLHTRLFIEVPCIDQVFELGRTVDFFYEHNSHFTTTSLTRLLARCANEVELVDTGYNSEVVFGLAEFRRNSDQFHIANTAIDFLNRAVESAASLRQELAALSQTGKRIAIWGGTGKAAAFINQQKLDSERFPLVVDSDPDKVGTFVPGTGQEIRFRDVLLEEQVDVILIATQWRAADIVLEIQRCGITFGSILIEHRGRLIDFFKDEHPYSANVGSSNSRSRVPIDDRHNVRRPQFLSRSERSPQETQEQS